MHKKVKETFPLITTLNESWLALRKQIKLKFFEQLEDIDENDIYIKPNTYNNVVKEAKAFICYLERISQDRGGIKHIIFNVETCKYFYAMMY